MDGEQQMTSETGFGPDGEREWVGGPGLFGSLARYWRVIVAATAVAAVVGFVVPLLLPARYEAQATLYLRDPGSPSILSLAGSSQSQGDHTVFMATQAGLAGSDEVFGRALQVLNRSGTPDDVRQAVKVTPSTDLASVAVRATADDPTGAADLANAVGTAYQQVAGEHHATEARAAIDGLQRVADQRNTELDAIRKDAAQTKGPDQATLERKAQHVADLIGTLQINQDQIASQAAAYGSGVQEFQPAVPPVTRSQPAPLLLALVGALVGLLAASGWAWWAAGRRRRVETDADAGAVLGVPMVAETPRRRTEPSGVPAAPPAETYHFVLSALGHALARANGKAVAVVSARPGDGKTTTVLNLALAARREGRPVLLVDGDERTRRLSQLCRLGDHFDVVGVTRDGGEYPSLPESGGDARVLQIGPEERNGHHPAVYFRTAFGKLISAAGGSDRLVLIDTPALLDAADAVTIADHADAVLLVVNRGTPLADLRRARERLAFTDTPLVGYVLNDGPAPDHAGPDREAPRGGVRGLLHRGFSAEAPQPTWNRRPLESPSWTRDEEPDPAPAPAPAPAPEEEKA